MFKNRKKLPKGVYIDKDHSKTTEKERHMLRPILNASHRLDKYKGKCRLEGPNLWVDGKCYHQNNLHTLPLELNTVVATSKSDDNTVGFFGELHPFSNFHPCIFISGGLEYHSSEQFIQLKNAEYFGDEIAMDCILKSTDAQDSKEIAMDIANFDKHAWNSVAEELCEPGITEKLHQNEHLMQALLDTGN